MSQLILPEHVQRAMAQGNTPAEMARKLREGFGEWRGDPHLVFNIDPDGKYWYVLQHLPGRGYIEVYASALGEPLDDRIFDHLAKNSPDRALRELAAAQEKQAKLEDDVLTETAEKMAEGGKKALFYARQAGLVDG